MVFAIGEERERELVKEMIRDDFTRTRLRFVLFRRRRRSNCGDIRNNFGIPSVVIRSCL